MKSMRIFTFLAMLSIVIQASAVSLAAETPGLKVTEMVVTTRVTRGNPIDSVRRISATSVKALYCFTRTTGTGEETAIRHVWYRNNEKVAEKEMPISGKRWRTYSRVPIDRGSPGQWRVEALDASGGVIKKVEFRVN